MTTFDKVWLTVSLFLLAAVLFLMGMDAGHSLSKRDFDKRLAENERSWEAEVKRVRQTTIDETRSKLHEHVWVSIVIDDPSGAAAEYCADCWGKR